MNQIIHGDNRLPVVRLPHPLDIDRQIESLGRIRTGWLRGDGAAVSKAGIAWLHEALLSRIIFDDQTLPHLYPTEDGNVQAEWDFGTVSADLHINLSDHQAIWGWSDLSNDENGARKLDLNKDTDWQWLSIQLTKLSELSPA